MKEEINGTIIVNDDVCYFSGMVHDSMVTSVFSLGRGYQWREVQNAVNVKMKKSLNELANLIAMHVGPLLEETKESRKRLLLGGRKESLPNTHTAWIAQLLKKIPYKAIATNVGRFVQKNGLWKRGASKSIGTDFVLAVLKGLQTSRIFAAHAKRRILGSGGYAIEPQKKLLLSKKANKKLWLFLSVRFENLRKSI